MSSNDKIEVIKLENESHDLPDGNANKSQQYMPSNIAQQRTQKHVTGMFQLPNNNTIYNPTILIETHLYKYQIQTEPNKPRMKY